MPAVNVSDLCYSNDGFTVVHCVKYKNDVKQTSMVLFYVFGTIGAFVGSLLLFAFAEMAYNKWKNRFDQPHLLTPRDDAQFKELSVA